MKFFIPVVAVQASSIHVFGGHLSVVGMFVSWSASSVALVKASQSTR